MAVLITAVFPLVSLAQAFVESLCVYNNDNGSSSSTVYLFLPVMVFFSFRLMYHHLLPYFWHVWTLSVVLSS